MNEKGGFYTWLDIFRDAVPNSTLPPGMTRRCVTPGNVMLALHEALPHLQTEDHTHESSQITYVIKGKMAVSIDGEKKTMEPGEFAYIAPGVPHHIQSFDEYALALDIFDPPRKDIQQRVDEITEQK